jgi:hypothetical protein
MAEESVRVSVSQVFVPGGMPTHTYNSRVQLGLEGHLKDYLDERHKILALSGPTKAGKTVLLRAGIDNGIWLSGGDIQSMDDFWSAICGALDVATEFESGDELVDGAESSTSGGGSVKPFGIGGHLDHTKTENLTSSRKESRVRKVSFRDAGQEALRSGLHTLVVDDFHYIDQAVQLSIVRTLKPLVFDGLPVVVASVPHRAYDAVRVEKEMTGRVEQLQIPLWRPDELQSIAVNGFRVLNVTDTRQIGRQLAAQCFQSPHLMQEFCLHLCKDQGVRDTCDPTHSLEPPAPDWNTFFRSRASNASKAAFDLLARGPRQRSDRKPRKRTDGYITDIYGAVLGAIAYTGPESRITYEQLRAALRHVLEGELPARHEITRVLDEMSKIAREQIPGEPVVDYDQEMSILHVTDPFFSYFLKWGFIEQYLTRTT